MKLKFGRNLTAFALFFSDALMVHRSLPLRLLLLLLRLGLRLLPLQFLPLHLLVLGQVSLMSFGAVAGDEVIAEGEFFKAETAIRCCRSVR